MSDSWHILRRGHTFHCGGLECEFAHESLEYLTECRREIGPGSFDIFRGKRLAKAAKRCSEMLERYQSDKKLPNVLRSISEEDNANDSIG